jgi:hypothetical protein
MTQTIIYLFKDGNCVSGGSRGDKKNLAASAFVMILYGVTECKA